MNKKWYVVRVQPRADQVADSELQCNGFETASPRIKVLRSKKAHTETPLFPGYLFLRWDFDGVGKPSLREFPHVVGWLNFGGIAPPVPDEVVASLTNQVEAINNLGRHFKPGDKVFVASNTVQSLAEVVEEAKSPEGRVRVLLQFLGRRVSVQVPWQNLQPVERQPSPKTRVPRRTRGRGRWIRGVGPTAVVN